MVFTLFLNLYNWQADTQNWFVLASVGVCIMLGKVHWDTGVNTSTLIITRLSTREKLIRNCIRSLSKLLCYKNVLFPSSWWGSGRNVNIVLIIMVTTDYYSWRGNAIILSWIHKYKMKEYFKRISNTSWWKIVDTHPPLIIPP